MLDLPKRKKTSKNNASIVDPDSTQHEIKRAIPDEPSKLKKSGEVAKAVPSENPTPNPSGVHLPAKFRDAISRTSGGILSYKVLRSQEGPTLQVYRRNDAFGGPPQLNEHKPVHNQVKNIFLRESNLIKNIMSRSFLASTDNKDDTVAPIIQNPKSFLPDNPHSATESLKPKPSSDVSAVRKAAITGGASRKTIVKPKPIINSPSALNGLVAGYARTGVAGAPQISALYAPDTHEIGPEHPLKVQVNAALRTSISLPSKYSAHPLVHGLTSTYTNDAFNPFNGRNVARFQQQFAQKRPGVAQRAMARSVYRYDTPFNLPSYAQKSMINPPFISNSYHPQQAKYPQIIIAYGQQKSMVYPPYAVKANREHSSASHAQPKQVIPNRFSMKAPVYAQKASINPAYARNLNTHTLPVASYSKSLYPHQSSFTKPVNAARKTTVNANPASIASFHPKMKSAVTYSDHLYQSPSVRAKIDTMRKSAPDLAQKGKANHEGFVLYKRNTIPGPPPSKSVQNANVQQEEGRRKSSKGKKKSKVKFSLINIWGWFLR